jgi:hypothetical protein
MKKVTLFTIIIIAFLFSCNNQQNPAKQPNKMENDSVAARVLTGSLLGEFCYGYTNKKDSVFLTATIGDSSVTGNLSYNFYEKDKNNGTINGKMKGDTLMADYTFMAEGMQSVRQVAFLLTDSTAKEGYGEMTEKNNKMIFTSPAKIAFDKSFVLSKKECLEKK